MENFPVDVENRINFAVNAAANQIKWIEPDWMFRVMVTFTFSTITQFSVYFFFYSGNRWTTHVVRV